MNAPPTFDDSKKQQQQQQELSSTPGQAGLGLGLRPHPLLVPQSSTLQFNTFAHAHSVNTNPPLSAPPAPMHNMFFFNQNQNQSLFQQQPQFDFQQSETQMHQSQQPKSSIASLTSSASTASSTLDNAELNAMFTFPNGNNDLDPSRRNSIDSELSLAMGFDELGFLSPVVARKASLAFSASNSVGSPLVQFSDLEGNLINNANLHPLLMQSPLSHSLPVNANSHMNMNYNANNPLPFNPHRRMSYQMAPMSARPLEKWDIDFLCRQQQSGPLMSPHPSHPQVSFLQQQLYHQQQFQQQPTPQSPISHQGPLNTLTNSPESTANPSNIVSIPTPTIKSSPPPKLNIDLTQQPRSTNFMNFFVKAIKPKQSTVGSQDSPSSPGGGLLSAFGRGSKSVAAAAAAAEKSNGLADDTTPTSATNTVVQNANNNLIGGLSGSSISPEPDSPSEHNEFMKQDPDWTPTTNGFTPTTPTASSVTTPTTKRMAKYKSASAPNLGTFAGSGSDTRPRDFICGVCHNRFLRRQDLSRHE
ncbi:UNVERIFIED_CONTAM: hypothetical protein HDU68_009264, partial [Siphonaria sp. JEL0065]